MATTWQTRSLTGYLPCHGEPGEDAPERPREQVPGVTTGVAQSTAASFLMVLQPTGWPPAGRDVAAACGYGQGCPTMIVDGLVVFPEPL